MTARRPPHADAITTIPLRKSTRDRLREMGAKGETYDALLLRLMDAYELARSLAEQGKERLRSERRLLVEFERVEAGAPLPHRQGDAHATARPPVETEGVGGVQDASEASDADETAQDDARADDHDREPEP